MKEVFGIRCYDVCWKAALTTRSDVFIYFFGSSFLRPVSSELKNAERDGGSQTEHQQAE